MKNKNIVLLVVLIFIIGAIWFLQSKKPMRDNMAAENISGTGTSTDAVARIASKSNEYPSAKELADIQGYINSPAFTLKSLIGKKVILLDFWTYSCINCIRTLPYLESWYSKYKDEGLEIVGVHTPEFDFEKNYDNVAAAVKKDGILYPVVLDSNYGTWNAYENSYWPREYLIDIDGFIVHDQIGEGNYDETEAAIQKALQERAQVLGDNVTISSGTVAPSDVISMDPSKMTSKETYFGGARNEFLGNGAQGKIGEQTLTIPNSLSADTLYLSGTWDFESEYALTKSTDAKIVYDYNAKNVYFVASSQNGVKVKVLLDGKQIPASLAGDDVASDGTVTIKENRLYDIVKGENYGEHKLELDVLGAGLQAFTFTFG